MNGASNPLCCDSKLRSLEALERRFYAAQADLLRLQQAEYSNSLPLRNKDSEESDPVYFHLAQSVHENLMTSHDKIFDANISYAILHQFVQKGNHAFKYINGHKSVKFDKLVLLDKFVPRNGTKNGRENKKRSKKLLSTRKYKKLGSLDLPQKFHKFDIFLRMHEMWKEYMDKLLKNTNEKDLPKCILDADLHGSMILVVDCKIFSFKGVCGIMIRETSETFGIITRADKFIVVPKKACVFVFQIGPWKVTLCGDKLACRNI